MYIVTGGFGFIGSNLVRELVTRYNKDVLVIDYEKRDYLDDLNYMYLDADEFYSNLDNYCFAAKCVFHEGAISSTMETDFFKLLKYNLNPSLDLIYYCRDHKIPLQYASSASVYGKLSQELWELPNKPVRPLNKYAKTKSRIDYVAKLVINSKKPPVLLQGMRYFNVYGPNEEHKKEQASPYHKFLNEFQTTGNITLFENSSNIYRDFISVSDAIDMKLKAFNYGYSGIFDLGTGIPKSIHDVALEICNKFETNPEKIIKYIPIPDNIKNHYQTFTKADVDWIANCNSISI